MESEICSLAGQIAAATARFLQVLAKFDELGGWTGPGIHSCAHWLSWKCGMSLHTGREHVRVARALNPLPVVRAAFEEGRVSYSKVRSITRVATPENEHRLVEVALTAPAAHLDRLVAGMKRATREPAPRESRFHTRWRWDTDTGDLVISGRMSAQDGAVLVAGLEHAERERNRTVVECADNEVPRPLGDVGPALVAMAEMANGAEAPVVGKPSEVIFLHEEGATRVNQGPSLDEAGSGETLCTAHVRRGRTKKGCILDFGRKRRITSPRQVLALIARDKCCRTPGCGRTRFLHAHHVRFWGKGGRTDLDNLILLCGTCHRALHRGSFGIVAMGEQRFEFRDARGKVMEPAPPMKGRADALWDPLIAPRAIVPAWGGDPLRIEYAVSVLLDAEDQAAA